MPRRGYRCFSASWLRLHLSRLDRPLDRLADEPFDALEAHRIRSLSCRPTGGGTAGTPDTLQVAAAFGDGTFRLVDLQTGEQKRRYSEPPLRSHGDASCVAVSSDGVRMVTGYDWHRIRQWDGDTGSVLKDLQGANGKRGAIGVADRQRGTLSLASLDNFLRARRMSE